ncbi:MAG: endolytic transglycosylase MltG, partial [Eubacterium sp.]|nr:endolytic transglycosylase MltG [Eubacterium sp.]
LEPVGGSSESVYVDIPEESTVADVANILYDEGVIKNAMVFQSYAGRHSRGNRTMQAGYYELNKNMSAVEIFNKMLDGDVYADMVTVVLPEGRNVKEMGAILEENGICTAQAFIDEAHKLSEYKASYPILSSIPDGKDRFLEGYLFPDTYHFEKGIDAAGVVTQMLNRFVEVYGDDLQKQTQEKGKTIDEIVIMASIVELETKLPEDRPNAASVFYNRMAAGMNLQSDITVDYARGEKTAVLTEEQTQFESPYNTYINPGLPVGPICSPGLDSIDAAINPADTNYLYFVADMDTGKLYFNETLEGHNADVAKYMN